MNTILAILSAILGIILLVFIYINALFFFLNMGYVLGEKKPKDLGIFDRIDNFWKAFWRKIIN